MFEKKPPKVIRGHNRNMLWPVLGLLAFALVFSLAVAGIWQKVAAQPEESAPSVAESAAPESGSEPEASSSAPEERSEPEAPEKPARPEGAGPASERVMGTYFDDAAFVGDSITEGIGLYGLMSNTTVLAGTSVNLDTVYTREVVKTEEGRITIMDALGQKPYAKLYIMLGGNEAREDTATFIARYGKLLDDIKALQPDALIYVQSILPVTPGNIYNLDNDHIDAFNAALLELSREKGVYFVNVAEALKNEKGELPEEASPTDGMHFGPEYYTKWFEYLKTHTVS